LRSTRIFTLRVYPTHTLGEAHALSFSVEIAITSPHHMQNPLYTLAHS
jgi:uracil DNA glycosylase